MRGWMTKLTVVAALVGFAVPALACDAMKGTHASTTNSSAKAGEKGQKAEKSEKAAKSSETKKETVAKR